MSTPNTEQTQELKAALQDVASRARRDGRHLDVGIVEAAISYIDAPRAEAAAAAATAGGKRGRGRPAKVPASVADLANGA